MNTLDARGYSCPEPVIMTKKALEKGITEVVFDRGGNVYHGRIQAVAEGAREAGLKF